MTRAPTAASRSSTSPSDMSEMTEESTESSSSSSDAAAAGGVAIALETRDQGTLLAILLATHLQPSHALQSAT